MSPFCQLKLLKSAIDCAIRNTYDGLVHDELIDALVLQYTVLDQSIQAKRNARITPQIKGKKGQTLIWVTVITRCP